MEITTFIDALRSVLSAELPDDVNPYDNLYDELGLDSFQAFELIVVTESLADCLVPPADVVELFTLADAFEYYQRLLTAGVELTES